MKLRPYQEIIIEKTRERMRAGVRSCLITSPCGSGKTVLTAHMLKRAAEKGIPSLFLVHRRELIKQSIKAFGEVGVPHGVIANNFNHDARHLIQLASVQTLSRRVNKVTAPKLVIMDECHHVGASTWAKIHETFKDAFHIGLTATPERLDGKGLGKWYKEIIHGPSVQWLIENGFLAPYKLYAPSSVNVSKMHMLGGDYKRDELSQAVDKPTITGDAIKHYMKLAPGKRAVVFCVSIEHSKHVVAQFQSAGIPSAHVDGETPTEERDEAVKKFASGKIQVLSNVELFGEGFDLPALEVAILLRPTASLGLFIQQTGRALRTSPGKETALILDHAGNVSRHGLPDEERDWSLEGHDCKTKGEKSLSVRICPSCFGAQKSGRPVCSFCGFVFEAKQRKVEHVDGDLREIDLDQLRRIKKSEQGRCSTLEELTELGKKRGYKHFRRWAHFLFQARQRRKVGV
jgi:superfamily II DNA or RNA helicase